MRKSKAATERATAATAAAVRAQRRILRGEFLTPDTNRHADTPPVTPIRSNPLRPVPVCNSPSTTAEQISAPTRRERRSSTTVTTATASAATTIVDQIDSLTTNPVAPAATTHVQRRARDPASTSAPA